MNYIDYILKSLTVFTISFFIGNIINVQFIKYQKSIPNITNRKKFIIAFIQLLLIISITYFLHIIKFFHHFFEDYTPNVLFSTFLLSLQSNMINNFKSFIHDFYSL